MVVGLVLMAAGLFCVLYRPQVGTPYYGPGRMPPSVMSPMFLLVTGFGGAIVAAIIGLSQTLPEARADRWAFLTHRPVTRSALFRAKAISGLILYAVATGVPLTGAVWWVATPGHYPCPFEWRMTLPAIADLSCGIAYYFLAVMTGMRQARWFGSRTFGFGAGIVCSFSLLIYNSFWQGELSCAIGITIAATAAWGTFITGGTEDRMPLLGRCAAAVTLFCGAFLIVGLITGVTIALGSATRIDFSYKYYDVTRDGQIVQSIRKSDGTLVVSDLQGNVLPQDSGDAATPNPKFVYPVSRYLTLPDLREQRQGRYRNFDTLVTTLASTNPKGRQTLWYYIPQLGLVAGYDESTSQLLGWLGPDGFTVGDAPPAHHFQGGLQSQPSNTFEPVLAFGDGAYRIDLAHRTTTQIFKTPPGEMLLAASQDDANVQNETELGDRARFSVMLTNCNLYVQDARGNSLVKTDLELNLDDYSQITVSRAIQPTVAITVVLCDPNYSRSDTTPIRVIDMRSDKGPASRYTLPPRWTPSPAAWQPLILPNVFLATAPLVAWFHPDAATRLAHSEFKFGLMASFISAIGCMAIAVNRLRLFGFGPIATTACLLFTFVLGAVGVVWIFSLAQRVPRDRCPSCGRWRSTRRERCEYCEAAQPLPRMNGTEIFEPGLV